MRLRGIAAAIALAVFLAPGVTHADVSTDDLAHLVGEGVADPGLPPEGCAFQHILLTATIVIVYGDHPGTYRVAFDGNSTVCETALDGEGEGTLTGEDIVGTAAYTRKGQTLLVRGDFWLAGRRHHIVDEVAACQVVATSYQPATSFTIVCPGLVLSAH
jgi:hypothetical protein